MCSEFSDIFIVIAFLVGVFIGLLLMGKAIDKSEKKGFDDYE